MSAKNVSYRRFFFDLHTGDRIQNIFGLLPCASANAIAISAGKDEDLVNNLYTYGIRL